MRKLMLGYLILLLLLFSSGCVAAPAQTASNGISIARRGESLKTTESAPATVPDPVVLPAVKTPEPTTVAAEETDQPALISTAAVNEDCEVLSRAQYEGRVLDLVNQARKSPLDSLDEHALLNQIARQHSQEMACEGFFSHDNPSLGSVEERIRASGYDFLTIGEVIASGYETPDTVVSAWLSSSAHREILLTDSFVHVGVGYAKLVGDDQPAFWTIVFAAPANP